VAYGNVKGIDRKKVVLYTSLNRKMKKLLTVPPPIVLPKKKKSSIVTMPTWDKKDKARHYAKDSLHGLWGDDVLGGSDDVGESIVGALLQAGAVAHSVDDENTVRVLKYKGYAWMMTQEQYDTYVNWATNLGVGREAPVGTEANLHDFWDFE